MQYLLIITKNVNVGKNTLNCIKKEKEKDLGQTDKKTGLTETPNLNLNLIQLFIDKL